MTIEGRQVVDLIAAREDVVSLVIVDHLEWEDVPRHLALLQNKVNDYVQLLEAGELKRVETPRMPDDPAVQIVQASKYPSPEAVSQEIELLRASVLKRGLSSEMNTRGHQQRTPVLA